ncbi:MAG: Sortase family protein [Candidatus Berkelbacteria bacterium Licking1014_7]|uniref:Sortase family protein n=1 Tax=Candidatus Berkelbacteria bacterium Licking1014_7 TaxID=2017147 RepID=A0A554LI92_9BACT|nr:MAG: Sortase family protein [Candidatus Berkelbacteria bacterium Licking1014_7]
MKTYFPRIIGLCKKLCHFRVSKFIFLIIVLAGLIIALVISGNNNSGAKWLPQIKKIAKKDISGFGLDIAKIDVWAPIIPQVDGYDEAIYLKAIEEGVAQFKDTKNPDENGNLLIFGHSEYYKDKPGDYKEVFKPLDKLEKGDPFNVYYQNKTFKYEIFESKKVGKSDWTIMDPTPEIPDDQTITLMTCWPPGTLDARWAVFAKQTP